MMKALVTKYLNIRTGFPELKPYNNPNDLYYKPGEAVDISEPCFGETYKGNCIWYKLEDGSFVWSGGVEDGRALFSSGEIKTDVAFWCRRFGITALREQVKDKIRNIRVSLLDTGIDESHPDLQGLNVITRLDATGIIDENLKTTSDKHGHGTHCAGILFGSGRKRITGVASGVTVNICRIMSGPDIGGGLSAKSMLRALKIVGEQSDIISISAGLNMYSDELEKEISELSDKGVVIVAAIGNQVNQSGFAGFPAKFKQCISVGALNSVLKISDYTYRSEKIDICFPGENIVSTGLTTNKEYDSDSGTSIATPFISGLAAILKAHDRSLTCDDIRSRLTSWSEEKITDGFSYRSIKDQTLLL